MATNDDRRYRPRDDEFRTEDEGGDMRGPYGGAGDYGGSFTAGGWAGVGYGGGYFGYGPESDIGAYDRGPSPGVSGGPAFSSDNVAYYSSGIPVPYASGTPVPYMSATSVPVPGVARSSCAGCGPRGYVRSDERIVEDICETLTRHPDIDATDISVAVENGTVTLSGTVADRYTKRLADDVAELTSGVHEVRNRLRIA